MHVALPVLLIALLASLLISSLILLVLRIYIMTLQTLLALL